ncbi:WD40 repeat-like protein [Rhizopogon vinicolor AM-OR11-026]|uniref:WD40 repeat-like protein n=1 Tax=Rhizopogon vinicolor AM-OR11-026 TaxID=1314800 RepID=A0A1B7N2M3_9AGAM|nr:WD40 repeat-like protein [Rhizopogon vinicolor AM-OR11-026]
MAFTSTRPAPAAKEIILTPVITLEDVGDNVSISYLPDGKQMISASWDKAVRRWDLQAGKEIEKSRKDCEYRVGAVAVSGNGRRVVTAGGNWLHGELTAWDVETGIVKTFQGHSEEIICIDISADSMLLASGSYDMTTRIWSLDTGKLVAGPFESAEWAAAIRFSPDSKKLAVNSWHADWLEFDASTLETVGAPFKGHTDIITGLALSPDGALVASASFNSTIKLWAFESRQLLASFHKGHEGCIRSVSYLPDGKQMISGSDDKTARRWDLKAGKEIEKARKVCEYEVRAVAVSGDSRWVVTADGKQHYGPGELKAWEVDTEIVKTFHGHSKDSDIICMDISADSMLLASGSRDGATRIWNLDTGNLAFNIAKSSGAVRFSPD